MACDWASLPDDMLELILQKLSCVVDFLRFRAVCKSWHSASRQNKKKRQHVPMLLVPTPDQNKPNKQSLYSFAMNQIYDNIQLNIPFSKRLAGSSHGWVVIPGLYQPCKKIVAVILFNPFYGKTICLPPVRSFTYEDEGNNHGDEVCDHDYIRVDGFEYRIAKVALSRDPHHYPENFELMITLSDLHSLALYKSSEKSWIYIPDHPELGMYFSDVIFYKDKFYFVNLRMGLGRIDVNSNILKDNGRDGGVSSPTPQIELVLECVYERFAEESKNIHRNYIVETSNGDLLLVQRSLKEVEQYREHLITWDFKLHKLQSSSWARIDSLGDDVLFLGDNHSMSVSALQFPECQRNCIYFTDDQSDPFEYIPDGPVDVGIYDLANSSFTTHNIAGKKDIVSPPIWILPTLQGYEQFMLF